MPRPTTQGKYVVPDAIQALKPNSISCTVKAIPVMSKKRGIITHYYVYERICKVDIATNNKSYSSGDCIGKIEGGSFCPNEKGIALLRNDAKNPEEDRKPDESSLSSSKEQASILKEERNLLQSTALNMNLNLENIDLQLKDYGEYALVLACTTNVLESLNQYFSVTDARTIYALSVIYFVEEYTPASYVKDIFEQSILSNKWPTLALSENMVGRFLKLLGRHPGECDKYSQSLIDNSSGLTAIDGHVILTCSRQNDLADYGNKYQKIGNKQLNILEAYDVVNNMPIASKAYEGGLPDKISVQDLLGVYKFPSRTTFLIDMGFYSEDDMEIYRLNNRHFVIPVPENTSISKAILSDISFAGSFVYEKTNENGITCKGTILYKETTVSEMEDAYQEQLNIAAEKKNKEANVNAASNEKPKKHYPRKIQRSTFGSDRLILYRDEDMHAKMVSEFRQQIGMDDQHTEERLAELGPTFGIIVLRTNLKGKQVTPGEVYHHYKKRWKVETHYNFVANTIKFCGLQTEDYCSMQGLSFLILTVGQIKKAVQNKMKSASNYVSHLSLKECIVKAAHLKLAQHIDKTWHIAITTKRHADMMAEMGVNMSEDIKKLNQGIF